MKPHLFPPVAQTVPPLEALPLLAELVERRVQAQELAGWRCLFIQHQLGDVCCQAQAMLALGIQPEEFFWAPIPYTAHPALPEALCERTGVPVQNFFTSCYTLRDNYDAYMKRAISAQIVAVTEGMAEGAPLLVIDDGAYFAAGLAANPELAARVQRQRVAVVEQTQRGIDKMQRVGLPAGGVPVVDVARSGPKKDIEPRYIAEAVARGTCRAIAAAEPKEGDAILLLGYGAIGRAVAEALEAIEMAGRLQVWDIDPSRKAQAEADGWTWWERGGEATFDYVIGCTGRAALRLADLDVVRHGGMLINAASGRHELPVDQLLESDDARLVGDREAILDGTDIHAPLRFMLSGERLVTVANGGLPITFCGDLNPTRPEKFDVTSCCMVHGGVQAALASDAGIEGLVALDAEFCEWVTQGWLRSEELAGR